MNAVTVLDEWADRYGELRGCLACSWLGTPLIVVTVLGMLWSLPVPSVLSEASPAINYATLFIMSTFVYWCILSVSLGVCGLLLLLLALAPSVIASRAGLPLGSMSAGTFIVCFGWLLTDTRKTTGHWLVYRNLQYLMLGPIWLLREAWRSLGLRY